MNAAAAAAAAATGAAAAADAPDRALARIAAAIGEPARARMLCVLLDGRARTGTELAAVAEVAASTASAHLRRLEDVRLVNVRAQGRHRYYTLGGARVAQALETLGVLAGARAQYVPSTPVSLRLARRCYDHIAGALGVALHERLLTLGWLASGGGDAEYELRPVGRSGLAALGIDAELARVRRRRFAYGWLGWSVRRFAYGCLDWSERRPHLAGALGAALLERALRGRWVRPALEGRELMVTGEGRRVFASLGLELEGLGSCAGGTRAACAPGAQRRRRASRNP